MTGLGGAVAANIVDPALAGIDDEIIARTGLAFYATRRGDLVAKIDARMRALSLEKYVEYLERLRGPASAQEWEALIAEVTIGETYFFRYPAQWRALRDIVPSMLLSTQGKSELRIWCAGCSNGAEVYSLAMLVQQDLAQEFESWRISILGTDICNVRLRQAQRGIYGEWELRAIPEQYRRNCFVQEGSAWVIRDEFKRLVRFEPSNLIHDTDAFTRKHCGFDIILCRNVMIYFSAEQNRILLKQFHDGLKEGGWFMTGHSEPYLEISNVFHPHAVPGAMLYRKHGGPRARAPLLEPGSCAPAVKSEVRARVLAQEKTPMPRDSARDARSPAALAPPESLASPRRLEDVRQLANAGAWSEASRACAKLCAANPLNAETHFMMALLHEYVGEPEAAVGALGRALYLNADFALAHYHAAMESAARNDVAAARRSLRNVFKSLQGSDDCDPVLSGDGLKAGELRELVKLQSSLLEGRRS